MLCCFQPWARTTQPCRIFHYQGLSPWRGVKQNYHACIHWGAGLEHLPVTTVANCNMLQELGMVHVCRAHFA